MLHVSWKRPAHSQQILPASSQLAVYRWKGLSLLPFPVYLGLQAGFWVRQNIKRSFETWMQKRWLRKCNIFPFDFMDSCWQFWDSLLPERMSEKDRQHKPASYICLFCVRQKAPQWHGQKQFIETGLYLVTWFENPVMWCIFIFSQTSKSFSVYPGCWRGGTDMTNFQNPTWVCHY